MVSPTVLIESCLKQHSLLAYRLPARVAAVTSMREQSARCFKSFEMHNLSVTEGFSRSHRG